MSEQPTATAPPAPTPARAPAAAPSSTSEDGEGKRASSEKAPAPDEPTTPLRELWLVAEGHSHSEIWGVTLADPATHVPSQIVLQKYLNANDGDVVKARDQLIKTLDWREKMKPLELVKKAYSKDKFGGLGYVTVHGEVEGKKEIFTWNIYGNTKSIEATFGHLDEYVPA
jgi:phosphatidylinositol transfer protein SFH5